MLVQFKLKITVIRSYADVWERLKILYMKNKPVNTYLSLKFSQIISFISSHYLFGLSTACVTNKTISTSLDIVNLEFFVQQKTF